MSGLCLNNIPEVVKSAVTTLHGAGYQAYLVGGCVRDSLLGATAHDWDIATDAIPTAVQKIFPGAKGVGASFGTVVLPHSGLEVTTFRRDLAYADGRHPVGVEYSSSLHCDLQRRDFTINAIAWDVVSNVLIDPSGGEEDLCNGVLRTVGDPYKRFAEDALRILRLARFAAQFGFDIYSDTWEAAQSMASRAKKLSWERLRAELMGIMAAPDPSRGLWILHEFGILVHILPELVGSERLQQGKAGAPTLLDHLIQAASCAGATAIVRLAGLLHDVGKMSTRAITPAGRVVFHGHEAVGADMAAAAMFRLRFSSADIDYVGALIKYHMWTGTPSAAALRRWMAKFGEQWVRDLLVLRRADHYASGGKEAPWLDDLTCVLNKIVAEEGVLQISSLAVDGHDVMQLWQIPPGPQVGQALNNLYEYVLANPQRNNRETLLAELARSQGRLSGLHGTNRET